MGMSAWRYFVSSYKRDPTPEILLPRLFQKTWLTLGYSIDSLVFYLVFEKSQGITLHIFVALQRLSKALASSVELLVCPQMS